MATYEDFKKIELVTAKILQAERVQGSDKLIKLSIQVGEETRPLVAGIGKAYAPEDLIEKTIVIIANLEPKLFKIKHEGETTEYESRGMLLAASDEGGKPILLTTMEETPSGFHIK